MYIKDIALTMYKGVHNVEVECEEVVNDNREEIRRLSNWVA